MSQYSEETKQRLYAYPIVCVLSYFGKRTDRPSCHGNYFSPFREEKSPSFTIDPVKNAWFDHGLGIGGGVVSLVGMLRGCSKADALDFLAELSSKDGGVEAPIPAASPETHLIVDRDEDLNRRVLLFYAMKMRGIPTSILRQYCREVYYHLTGGTVGSFYSIGFRNNSGGWALRNSRSKNSSSPSDITSIDIRGEHSLKSSTDRVTVFEGFFDFLSWLVYRGLLYPDTDICVLNSTSNVARALEYLRSHDEITLCLDNDSAGQRAVQLIAAACPELRLTDMRPLYSGYNDFNEFLTASRSVGAVQDGKNIKYPFNTNSSKL